MGERLAQLTVVSRRKSRPTLRRFVAPTSGVWDAMPERFALGAAYHDVAAVIGWDAAVALGFYVWQNRRPPSRDDVDPVHGGGLGVAYIPVKATPEHFITNVIGAERAALLSEVFGGLELQFPSLVAASIPRRDAAIVRMLREGVSPAVVAFLFDFSPRHIRRIARKHGWERSPFLPSALRA